MLGSSEMALPASLRGLVEIGPEPFVVPGHPVPSRDEAIAARLRAASKSVQSVEVKDDRVRVVGARGRARRGEAGHRPDRRRARRAVVRRDRLRDLPVGGAEPPRRPAAGRAARGRERRAGARPRRREEVRGARADGDEGTSPAPRLARRGAADGPGGRRARRPLVVPPRPRRRARRRARVGTQRNATRRRGTARRAAPVRAARQRAHHVRWRRVRIA